MKKRKKNIPFLRFVIERLIASSEGRRRGIKRESGGKSLKVFKNIFFGGVCSGFTGSSTMRVNKGKPKKSNNKS